MKKPINKKVEDYSGKVIPFDEAILIPKMGQFIHKDDKYLDYDVLTGEAILVNPAITNPYSVLDSFSNNGEPLYKFTIYPEAMANATIKDKRYLVTYETAKKLGLNEDLANKRFSDKKIVAQRKESIIYSKFPHPKIDKATSSKKLLIEYGVESPTNIISEGKPYTFGIEIETSSGVLPEYARFRLNTDCQYDGSILSDDGQKNVGGEYTTGVLFGDAGFRQLYKILSELSRRCTINSTCSVHVHLGNIVFNKETVVLLYKAFMMLEEELFDMMPKSRRQREHCQKMRKMSLNLAKRGVPYKSLIDGYYKQIFKMISCGKELSKTVNKTKNHPLGKTCNYDRSTPRYWWINFVPALFNVKGKENYTIEIRNHSASLDFIVIRNWVLICMGIISFVENNRAFVSSAKNLSIKQVLLSEYKHKAQYLINYIESRKDMFMKDDSRAAEEAEYKRDISGMYKESSLMNVVKA